MAGTYLQMAQATTDAAFKGRVQVACFIAAATIKDEADTVTNHTLRVRLATEVLPDPATRIRQFLWICSTAPTISGTVGAGGAVSATDDVIQAVVNGQWDVVAGWSLY